MKLEIIIFFAVIIVLGLIVLITIKGKKGKKLDQEFYQEQWQHITKLLSDGRNGWRLAIIDADKLLDMALKQSGVKGQTMGDRLRSRRSSFTGYNRLWSAHKLRNRLVHEPRASLSKDDTQKALTVFKKALKELGALK